jgi:hypothetical protein
MDYFSLGKVVPIMYVPKKLKWDTLSAFKKHLETETTEKIVSYNGYEIITETTVYGLLDSQLSCLPLKKEIPKKRVKSDTNKTNRVRRKGLGK